jgi:hypothetical protein
MGVRIPRSEHDEQAALIDWANAHIGKWPELDWLYAIINGIPLPGSMLQRVKVINYMKAEGMRPGVSDLCLPCARGGYFGLYLELKKKGGKIREGQGEFLAFVSEQGYFDAVCYSADEAIEVLTMYLNMPRTVVQKPKKQPVHSTLERTVV